MHIVSVQRGTIRQIAAGTARAVPSGIDKRPVPEIEVVHAEVVGDEIESPQHHGGEGQAVYLYSRSDYEFFEASLGAELEPGAFGENVTIDAWSDEPRVGDRLRFRDAELELTGPRVPCRKFAARISELFDADVAADWIPRFTAARRPGCYARVIVPGSLRAGDHLVERVPAPDSNIGIMELIDLHDRGSRNPAAIRRALDSPVDGRIRAWLESLELP